MKKILNITLITILILIFVACGGPKPGASYVDPTAVDTVNTDFGSTDLNAIAQKMTESLLSFPPLVKLTATKRPILFIEKVGNRTSEHIDTQAITDTISTKLIQSGKYRFVDMSKVSAVKAQLNYQNNSGMVDPQKAIAFGKQVGAEYMLYGSITSITKRNTEVKDVFYQFTLKLMDLKTGLIEWQDQKQIKKINKRGSFSW